MIIKAANTISFAGRIHDIKQKLMLIDVFHVEEKYFPIVILSSPQPSQTHNIFKYFEELNN